MIISAYAQAISGAEAVWDLHGANGLGLTTGYVPGHLWPTRLVVTSAGAIAFAVGLEYVDVGAGTSTYDGVPSGALTGATMTGAYLVDAATGFTYTLYVKPFAVQRQNNLKVHLFGASGNILISAERQ